MPTFSLHCPYYDSWYLNKYHSLSLSIIVTTAWLGLSTINPLGSEDEIIVRSNCSLNSNILSSIIGVSKETEVTPAGNVTVYGPEIESTPPIF